MPHNNSARKRLRKNETRRLRNRARTTELKSLRKKLLRAVHDGHQAEAATLYRTVTQRLDQAASLRTIHPNAAARTKSRLAAALAKGPAIAATGDAAPKAKAKAPKAKPAAAKAPAAKV
jgi:small subunit ribosomal protein S20